MFRKYKNRRKLRRNSSHCSRGHHRRLSCFEPLEQRLVLATQVFNVTTTADEFDFGNSTLSLREAISQANNVSQADDVVINLQSGATYSLQRSSGVFHNDDSESFSTAVQWGDLDLRRSMTINGNGAFLGGEDQFRIFEISSSLSNQTVVLNNMTIQHGWAASRGAGIFVNDNSDLTLNNVALLFNQTAIASNARGAALYAPNGGTTVAISGGDISHNAVYGDLPQGGAIFFAGEALNISGTRFFGNDTFGNDGAAVGDFGSGGSGGAIYVASGDLDLAGTTFDLNSANGGDGVSGVGEGAQGGDGGIGRGGAIYFGGGGQLGVGSPFVWSGRAESGVPCPKGWTTSLRAECFNSTDINSVFTATGRVRDDVHLIELIAADDSIRLATFNQRFPQTEPLVLEGDDNENGVVDAAAYTEWRDKLGSPAGTLPNDTSGAAVGLVQFNSWKANFGNSGSGAGSGAVPEPASVGMLLVGLGILVLKIRR